MSNCKQTLRETIHRLIIENRDEDGVITPNLQKYMADEVLVLIQSETTKARLDELHQMDNYITETSGYDWYPVDFKVYIDDRIAALQQLFESEQQQ